MFLMYEIYFSSKIYFYFNNTIIYILCVGLMNKYSNDNIQLKIERMSNDEHVYINLN